MTPCATWRQDLQRAPAPEFRLRQQLTPTPEDLKRMGSTSLVYAMYFPGIARHSGFFSRDICLTADRASSLSIPLQSELFPSLFQLRFSGTSSTPLGSWCCCPTESGTRIE